jgi:hypothetical protein
VDASLTRLVTCTIITSPFESLKSTPLDLEAPRNMAEEDYDSSDLEFDAPTNPFFSAGLASIEAIIDFSAEDRIRSKKLTKTLEFSEASPKTEYLTALWYNRFVAFRLHSPKKRSAPILSTHSFRI